MRKIEDSDIIHLTRDWILSRTTQEEIFEFFMGRTVELFKYFRSPLRKDRHPTCTMAYFDGVLLYRDWSWPKAMDCFGFVMSKYSCDFPTALHQIASEMNLWDKEPIHIPIKASANKSKTTKKDIQVKVQPFTQQDIDYLKSYHLTSRQTDKFRVFSVKQAWLEGKIYYVRQASNPAIAYYFGRNEEDSSRWKIYFYKARKGSRFLGNTNRINGWVQLPEQGTVLVITKSMKDVMVYDLFGIPAIAMQSETTMPYPRIMNELSDRFDLIVSHYDFDWTGVTHALALRRKFAVMPFFLTDGRFGTEDFKAKDLSDYIQINGPESTEELLRKAARSLGLNPSVVCTYKK